MKDCGVLDCPVPNSFFFLAFRGFTNSILKDLAILLFLLHTMIYHWYTIDIVYSLASVSSTGEVFNMYLIFIWYVYLGFLVYRMTWWWTCPTHCVLVLFVPHINSVWLPPLWFVPIILYLITFYGIVIVPLLVDVHFVWAQRGSAFRRQGVRPPLALCFLYFPFPPLPQWIRCDFKLTDLCVWARVLPLRG